MAVKIMTKTEAVTIFKTYNPDWRERLKADWLEIALHWDMYVDSLCKAGAIRQRQYSNWANPFSKKQK